MEAAAKHDDGVNKTVFELQAVNWKTEDKLSMPIFIEHLELLKQLGAIHLGYYPDNVYKDQPRLQDLQHYFSLTGLQ